MDEETEDLYSAAEGQFYALRTILREMAQELQRLSGDCEAVERMRTAAIQAISTRAANRLHGPKAFHDAGVSTVQAIFDLDEAG